MPNPSLGFRAPPRPESRIIFSARAAAYKGYRASVTRSDWLNLNPLLSRETRWLAQPWLFTVFLTTSVIPGFTHCCALRLFICNYVRVVFCRPYIGLHCLLNVALPGMVCKNFMVGVDKALSGRCPAQLPTASRYIMSS